MLLLNRERKSVVMERKCNCCGSNELVEGVIQTNDALKLVFLDNEETKKLLPKAKKIKSYRCAKCGNILLVVEENK